MSAVARRRIYRSNSAVRMLRGRCACPCASTDPTVFCPRVRVGFSRRSSVAKPSLHTSSAVRVTAGALLPTKQFQLGQIRPSFGRTFVLSWICNSAHMVCQRVCCPLLHCTASLANTTGAAQFVATRRCAGVTVQSPPRVCPRAHLLMSTAHLRVSLIWRTRQSVLLVNCLVICIYSSTHPSVFYGES